MRGRDITLQLAVTVTAIFITLDGGGVFALNCVTCTNHDYSQKCFELFDSDSEGYEVEECLDKTAEDLTAVCAKVIRMDCQAHVYGDRKILVGMGKGELKRWKWLGCAYVDATQERYKKHGQCYWQRFRSGRDVEHKVSGFKVVARSSVEQTCYCSTDECNRDAEQTESDDDDEVFVDNCFCGPRCHQASRDECESPDFVANDTHPTEPHTTDCKCPDLPDPPTTQMPDCGRDPNIWEPEKVGTGTYRHEGEDSDGEASGAVERRGGGGWRVGAAVVACWWRAAGNLGGG